MDFESWVHDVLGKTVGTNPSNTGQCVGLVEDYVIRVCGMPAISTDGGEYPGYAGSLWDNANGWGKQSPSAQPMPGWIGVWGRGPFTPETHTAVFYQAGLYVTQNPGPAVLFAVPPVGLRGYLVPPGAGSTNAITAANVQTVANDPISGVTNFVNSVTNAGNWVSGNWKRIGIFAIGAILLLIALLQILDQTGASKWTGTTIRNIRSTIQD